MRARQRHFNPRDAGATIALDSRYGFNQSDGTGVSTWEDRSRTNNDGTQATAASQPTYETSEIGGQPAIRFDGSNDFLSFTTSNFAYTSGASVFAVIKPTSMNSGYGSVISEFGNAGNSIGCQPSVFPNNAIEPATDVFGPGGIRRNSTVTNSTWFISGWHWTNWSTHKTNGDTRISVNGKETSGAAYGSNPSGFTSTTKSIGRFDTGGGGGSLLNGDIALISAMPAIQLSLRKRLYHAAAFSFKIACN